MRLFLWGLVCGASRRLLTRPSLRWVTLSSASLERGDT
jgi:hypothetical protein